jgi:hypothetical protein
VTQLTLSGVDGDSGLLQAVCSRYSQIEEITAAGLGMTRLALQSGTLQRLRLPKCLSLRDAVFDCPALTLLDVSGSEYVRVIRPFSHRADKALNRVSFALLLGLARSCPRLATLDLTGCMSVADDADAGVLMTSPTLEALAVLRLTDSGATDAVVNLVQFLCPNLAELDVSGCDTITEFATYLPSLRSVGVRLCPQLRRLVAHCPALQDVRVEQCALLATVEVKNPSLHSVTLRNCPQLGEVVLQCAALVQLDVSGTAVTDSTLTELALECPVLRSVLARGCRRVTLKRLRRGLHLMTA